MTRAEVTAPEWPGYTAWWARYNAWKGREYEAEIDRAAARRRFTR